VIRLRGIAKSYNLDAVHVRALRGVDLDVERGEYVGIVGPSGSGKTTLMELLGCLSRPTAGTYEFDGRPVEDIDEAGLALIRGTHLGFVFQTFNLLPRLTAAENVELPLLYRGVPRRRRRTRALELLDRFGLGDRAGHRPDQLSGGERQRVAIARALVNRPSVVLADEPTGSLDTVTGETILALLEQLHGDGLTILMVTHDPRIAARVGRLIRLRDGLIESDERHAAG
jgi:putative ABC transport system ATP-binding protein